MIKTLLMSTVILSGFVNPTINLEPTVSEPPIIEEESNEDEEEVTGSEYATPQSETDGSVVENVDENNNEYPITDSESSKRQFITIVTKSGKEFHLIINHDESANNVAFLTEVSEQDLLNLIELPKEDIIIVEDEDSSETLEIKKENSSEKNEGSNSSLIFYVVIFLVIGGIGYYFKVLKPKKNKHVKNEFDDDGEIDDYEPFIDEGNDIDIEQG